MSDDLNEALNEAEQATETELLDTAFSNEPDKGAEPEPEKSEAQPEQAKAEKQPRDEKGKFAAKAEQEKTVETTDKPKGEDRGESGQIPSWRLKEEADNRRAAEERARTLETQLTQLNARLASLEKSKEQPKQETIDPLLDPEGFARSLQQGFDARLSEMQLNNSLGLAHIRHGEKFEKAYEALLAEGQAGNRALIGQLTGQANPGEAIVRWFNNREILKEVGSDPAAYRQRLREELLKDPEFLKQAHETIASQAGQQKSPGKVDLPPSLSGVAASRNANDDLGDTSDKGLLDYAFK